jgi:hypothetical protein
MIRRKRKPTASSGRFDCDGDLDVIKANRLMLNDGKGRFTNSGQELGSWKSRNIAVGVLRRRIHANFQTRRRGAAWPQFTR